MNIIENTSFNCIYYISKTMLSIAKSCTKYTFKISYNIAEKLFTNRSTIVYPLSKCYKWSVNSINRSIIFAKGFYKIINENKEHVQYKIKYKIRSRVKSNYKFINKVFNVVIIKMFTK